MFDTLSVFSTVVLAVAVACFIVMAEGVAPLISSRNHGRRLWIIRGGDVVWLIAIAIGAAVGAINYFAPHVGTILWLAPLFLAVLIAALAALTIWWWYAGCDALPHLIPFAVLAILAYFPMKSAAAMTTGLVTNAFWQSVILTLPAIAAVAAIAAMLVVMFLYWGRNHASNPRSANERRWWRRVALIVALLAAALLIGLVGTRVDFGNFSLPTTKAASTEVVEEGTQSAEPTEEEATATVEEEAETEDNPADISGIGFYNLSLQNDGDDSNDFNFGWNALEEYSTATEFDQDFRTRLEIDPVFAAGVMAWADANVGTRFTGKFHDPSDPNAKWAEDINAAKDYWINNPDQFRVDVAAFEKFLDTAQASVEEKTSGLNDQMYMNPYTSSGIPDIIVMETVDHDGHFLVYTFTIKGQKFPVSYRIECGYQPTNVAKIMEIEPAANPVKKTTPTTSNTGTPSSSPKPSSTTKPSTTKPATDPKPSSNTTKTDPKKDTAKVEPKKNPTETTSEVGTNDTRGWIDTNNGVGAQESAVQPASGSSHKTQEEVKQATENNKAANETSRAGGASNEPSTSSSSDTKVSNNADKGTGNGGIDKATTVKQQQASTSDGSSATSGAGTGGNAAKQADGAWGGPAD